MEISPYLLFLLLLYSIFFGITVGLVGDAFRLIRMLLGESAATSAGMRKLYEKELPFLHRALKPCGKRSKLLFRFLIFFCDVLVFCFSAAGLAVLCYHFNSGRFRFYKVFACLGGFLGYRFALGKVVLYFSEGIIFLFRAFFCVVFYLFSRPFVAFARILANIFKKLYTNLRFSIAKSQKILYNRRRKKGLLADSRRGFCNSKEWDP